MKSHNVLTQKELKVLLHYDPQTGIFTRLICRNGRSTDRVAGTISGKGYRYIWVNDRGFLAHRLAWLYMTGSFPSKQIDHINMDKVDNRWSNLREATGSQNLANSGLPRHNRSGLKGASYNRQSCKWHACISIKNRTVHIGDFPTADAAHAAYCRVARQHRGEFARVG